MEYYVSQKAGRVQKGTARQPFLTIGQAAALAAPGDTVWIGGGTYREWVIPGQGGEAPDNRIVYRNLPGEEVIISGAEEVTGWLPCGNSVWRAVLPGERFGDYNPYADEIFGDWYDDFGQTHHTGEIFMDGKALYEAPDLAGIDGGGRSGREYSWFSQVTPEKTEIWVHVPDQDPNEHRMEASVRPYCFFPKREGVNYLTVSGLILEKAATQWAPPTAFQPAAIGTNWSKGWIIENCVVRQSKCSGISIGKRREERDNIWSKDPYKSGTQTYTEIVFANLKKDWSKENVGGHIIRNNEIHDCGQAGIVGCMGGAFSVLSHNHIHDINNRREFGGAEMAGIKLHAAIDVLIEQNLIHDCVRGLWLDWEAQGARVSKNAFFANSSEDVFIEVCHGPCTVDHNILLSEYNLQNTSQGTAYVQNLFAGKVRVYRDPNRFTMYHFPHDTSVAGLMVIYGGDDRVCGNIYAGRGKGEESGNAVYNSYPDGGSDSVMPKDGMPMSYTENKLPVFIRDNLYINGAKKYALEKGAVEEDFCARFSVVCLGGKYYLETNLQEYLFKKKLTLVTTHTLGKAFQAEAAYEGADAAPLTLCSDFSGMARGRETIPGPLEKWKSRVLLYGGKSQEKQAI